MKKGDIVRVKTNAELLNYLFNKDYKQWMKTTYEYNDHIVWMVHFDGEKRDGWKNHLGEKLIIEENTDRLVKPPETYLKKRIVFSKHNGYFIFEGIFKYDNVRSIPTSIRYYNLLSETFLEENEHFKPNHNKSTFFHALGKNACVIYNNKKFRINEFTYLYKNNLIDADIPWVAITENTQIFSNYSHNCTTISPTFKPIICVLKTNEKNIKCFALKCEDCASIFIDVDFLNNENKDYYLNIINFNTEQKKTIPKIKQKSKKKEHQVLKFPKWSNTPTYFKETLTPEERRRKWAIEHPYKGGSCSHK